ncbi:hypothetical protein [Pseudoxanthomonas sp. PXM02]|uniref:DUF6998 domain-containing protein n=1 Tax=Pseudoxanthomonas sp. PXM02 TaxID=2769294 RepID=UPI00177F3ABE|nr:hypothetical protein [Pseudoxanthomonas sp. PXM02]MBD9480789.1 hypothetical protein [Pseudoxanthomonas sp. PXM02]
MTDSAETFARDRILAAQAILASVFASQKALRALAPEYSWSGLGNLLGDFGELLATDHYKLQKAPAGSGDFDARTADGLSVQIKTNFASSQIGFRGQADLLLVLGIRHDGSWEEIYFGPYAAVKELARFSGRDNKHMISVTKLKALVTANNSFKPNQVRGSA